MLELIPYNNFIEFQIFDFIDKNNKTIKIIENYYHVEHYWKVIYYKNIEFYNSLIDQNIKVIAIYLDQINSVGVEIIKYLGLKIHFGMSINVIEEIYGKPVNSNQFLENQITIDYILELKYSLSLTIDFKLGLKYFVFTNFIKK